MMHYYWLIIVLPCIGLKQNGGLRPFMFFDLFQKLNWKTCLFWCIAVVAAQFVLDMLIIRKIINFNLIKKWIIVNQEAIRQKTNYEQAVSHNSVNGM